MSSRFGRAGRGLSVVVLWATALLALPALAQVRPEGVAPGDGGQIAALVAGDQHACALKRDGSVLCWGRNDFGQAMAPPPEVRFVALGADESNTCGVRDDGNVQCWGRPGPILQAPDGPFTAVAVGDRDACGLRPDGQATCWGDHYDGEPSLQPQGTFVALSAERGNTCGLRADGMVECWSGQPGVATTLPGTHALVSVGWDQLCTLGAAGNAECWNWNFDSLGAQWQSFVTLGANGMQACGLRSDGEIDCWGYGLWSMPPQGPFTTLAVGSGYGCALRAEGTVSCWGDNGFGQTTPPVELTTAPVVAAGGQHTCALRQDRGIDCWGDNGSGQSTPPPGLYTAVGSGDNFSCGLRDDGTLSCWGDNGAGQLAPPMEPMLQMGIGSMHGCAVSAITGEAHCWGWNSNGQATPPVGTPLVQVSAGFVHSCAVTRDALTGICWGYNGEGQTNVPMLQPGESWRTIEAGDQHSCGLLNNGTLRCWGSNLDGQSWQVPTGYFHALSAGAHHNCAIRTDGRLACWGANWAGQTDAPGGTFVAVSAGNNHSCAIRSDGARQCWGNDGMGQAPQFEIIPDESPVLAANTPSSLRLLLLQRDGAPVTATFRIAAGSLPPGLVLTESGELAGTPTVAGTYPLTVVATDANGFGANRQYDLVIDATPPAIYPYVDGYVGDNGWYASNVYVDWFVYDPESGYTWQHGNGCTLTSILTDTPGTTITCTAESAGGVASRSVTIKRDLTRPETALTAQPEAVTGQATAVFAFAGSDATAGIQRFECSLDGAAFATCASPQALQVAAGSHELRVRAVDNAGNVDATPASHAWRVDTTAPQVTPTVSGSQGANGWYVGDVQIAWNVVDAESAIATSTVCDSVSVTSDTAGASFTCTASSVGGTTTRTVTIKRDTVAPSVVAAATTAANVAGWYKADVAVAFSCSDATAGVVACPAAQQLGGEGTLSSQARTVSDAAGNTATSNTVTVRIDRTAPTLAPAVTPGTLLLNSTVAASANGSDALSGIASASCAALATGSIGNKSVACAATDAAGNSANGSAAYRVVYGFNGFTAPVQNPTTLNVFKAGRSVPLRWRVVDAQGAPVSNLTAAAVGATAISCPGATENRITVYGGSNSQLQNLGNGYYQLDWLAPSSYRNTCKALNLDVGDGEAHPLQFKFN